MPLFRSFALILTSFYFAGPLLILSELLRPEISVPILGLFCLWAVPLARSRFETVPALPRPFSRSLLLSSIAAAALCFAWIYLSGIGGYAVLRWDYLKHNLIFSALLDQFLPVKTDIDGEAIILHYSFAYYITPVRLYQLLRALGVRSGLDPLLVVIYTSALFLSIFLLARARPSILLLTVMFVFSAGLDLIGLWAFQVRPWIVATVPLVGIEVPANLEWWGVPYAPQSLTMNLYWAPQHFFAALIGTVLLYVLLESGRPMALRLIDTLILVVACAYWSPYVAVGLGALALIKLAIDHDAPTRLREEGLAPLLTFRGATAWLFAGAFASVTAIFYAAAKSLSAPSLLLLEYSALAWLLTYVINYAPLLIVAGLTFWKRAWKATASGDGPGISRSLLPVLAACLAASAVLLLMVHGRYNDWAIRTTLPLSIALTLLLTQAVSGGLKRSCLAVMVGVIVLSSASSLSQIAQAILLPPNRAPYGSFVFKHMGELVPQYEGRADSILYRYLARGQ